MFVDLDTIRHLLPEVTLVCGASVIYLGGTIRSGRAGWTLFALAGYAAAAYWLLALAGPGTALAGQASLPRFSGPLVIDELGFLWRCAALGLGVLFTLIASCSARRELANEYLGTLMVLVLGLMLVPQANDLILLFVSLELISIPTYVLLYLGRRDRATGEAAVKYFFLSLFASVLFLYGLSFLYGLAGTTTLIAVDGQPCLRQAAAELWAPSGGQPGLGLAQLGFVLVVSGLGFKIAAVPFHFYAPDVYQGATNTNAGLLSVAPKIAGILALVRLLVLGFPLAVSLAWQVSLVLALLTMTLGNVCALWQSHARRLLAYSAVAHAGYLPIGLSVAFAAGGQAIDQQGGVAATVFYLAVYSVATVGAFAALTHLCGAHGELSGVDELAGLGTTRPGIAAMLSLCLFSLAGIPPLAGFWGKLTLLLRALQTAISSPAANVSLWFGVLAVAGAVNAAIAAAYYLRIIAVMYFRPATHRVTCVQGWGARISLGLCAALLLAAGLFPKLPLDAAKRSESIARQSASRSSGQAAAEAALFPHVAERR